MDVPLSRDRQHWRYCRVLVQRTSEPTGAKRFLRKAFKRHGRPERIVIDGSQTNREAILLCDTISFPGSIKAKAEADPYSAKCLSE